MKISQLGSGKFQVIRTAAYSGRGDITDRITDLDWAGAVNLFSYKIRSEKDGCTWQIICPDGQIGAEAEF